MYSANMLRNKTKPKDRMIKTGRLSAQAKRDWKVIHELYRNSFCIMSRETQEKVGQALKRVSPLKET